MIKLYKYKRNGFTLMELLIALIVLGLMFSFVLPVLQYSNKASKSMNKLDVYHDVRRVDQEVFSELKLGSGILYPPMSEDSTIGDWYHQLIFRNHLNQVVMLYVNKNDKLMLLNYDDVKDGYLSLGKLLGSNIKEFAVRRHGSSVVEYKLTFDIDKKDFIVSNLVTLVNVF